MFFPPVKIDKNISQNFDALKFASIMMVFFGHFFGKEIPLIHIPVTVGLVIFSFSSGYFTSLKYRGEYSIGNFWKRKIERLAPNLLLVNLVLLVLFLIQGRSGIWTWHTVLNVMGLNGFLNWFMIQNISPYGRGMWFFTLLLIFYAVYPMLEKMSNRQFSFFLPIFILSAYCFSLYHQIGHALWITACGFIIGVFCAKVDYTPPRYIRIITLLSFITMLFVNIILDIKLLNFFFILLFSIFFIYSIFNIQLYTGLYKIISFFSACILEIYLLHGYFSLKITDYLILDFIISVSVVLILSKIINSLSIFLVMNIKKYY